jgi:hypothetical protein
MLPTKTITCCTPLTSSPLLRYRLTLGTYPCRCFALIRFFLLCAFATGATIVAKLTLAAIAAGIARRFSITGSCVVRSVVNRIFIGVKAGEHGNAQACGGNQF